MTVPLAVYGSPRRGLDLYGQPWTSEMIVESGDWHHHRSIRSPR